MIKRVDKGLSQLSKSSMTIFVFLPWRSINQQQQHCLHRYQDFGKILRPTWDLLSYSRGRNFRYANISMRSCCKKNRIIAGPTIGFVNDDKCTHEYKCEQKEKCKMGCLWKWPDTWIRWFLLASLASWIWQIQFRPCKPIENQLMSCFIILNWNVLIVVAIKDPMVLCN